MSKPLDEALARLIDATLNGIDATTTFLAAEIPDVVQQLLIWKMTESLLYFVLGVSLILSPWVTYKLWGGVGAPGAPTKGATRYEVTLTHDEYGRWHDAAVFLLLPSAMVIAAGFVVGDLDWLKILLAPKIYLLEYAKELIK